MARIPTDEENAQLQAAARNELVQKEKEFVADGKVFKPNRAGVMPEDYRTTVPGRTIENSEATE